MPTVAPYPVGIPGMAWNAEQVQQWRAARRRQRRYDIDVVQRVEALSDRFDKQAYGLLDYDGDLYTLFALRSRSFDPGLPLALVTGGVHGYETSGILSALDFLQDRAAAYAGKINLLVAPCVNPWSYEHVQRWNYDAVDPNRNFVAGGPSQEATALMSLIGSVTIPFLLHIDLHETTDTDETEFRPALAARDGKQHEPDPIPDGFYLVDDSANPQPEFQQAVISAVAGVTHIALPDESGNIIGSPVVAHGVIEYPLAELGLCASITGARYTTTTEVYPDSPRTSPTECRLAQVTAICAALDYCLERA